MDELGLFTVALGLSVPWRVIRSEFDTDAAQLDLYLGFEHGVRQVSVPGVGVHPVVRGAGVQLRRGDADGKGRHDDPGARHRIWRIVEHHVHAARDQLDCSGMRRVGVDETSARKGQDCVSIFADLDARRVVFATEGRSAETVACFAADPVRRRLGPPSLWVRQRVPAAS